MGLIPKIDIVSILIGAGLMYGYTQGWFNIVLQYLPTINLPGSTGT